MVIGPSRVWSWLAKPQRRRSGKRAARCTRIIPHGPGYAAQKVDEALARSNRRPTRHLVSPASRRRQVFPANQAGAWATSFKRPPRPRICCSHPRRLPGFHHASYHRPTVMRNSTSSDPHRRATDRARSRRTQASGARSGERGNCQDVVYQRAHRAHPRQQHPAQAASGEPNPSGAVRAARGAGQPRKRARKVSTKRRI